jgi:hypothetical protein
MLRRQAALDSDDDWWKIGGQTWSFAETLLAIQGHLHAAGIERGDHGDGTD